MVVFGRHLGGLRYGGRRVSSIPSTAGNRALIRFESQREYSHILLECRQWPSPMQRCQNSFIHGFIRILFIAGAFSTGCSPRPDRTPVDPAAYSRPVRLACVGDSLTANEGCWPVWLAGMLGPQWEVMNFGRGGAVILSEGDTPYMTLTLPEVLASEPDVVVVLLGTNDSKPRHWYYKKEFERDYGNLLAQLQAVPTRPRLWVCLPPPAFPGQWGIDGGRICEMLPVIRRVACRAGVPVIDLHTPFTGRPERFPDQIHPDVEASKEIADIICQALTGGRKFP